MAYSDKQDGTNGDCASDYGDSDTLKEFAATGEKHCADDTAAEQHNIYQKKMNMIASHHITKSLNEDMVPTGTEIACNEFTTKTWKDDLTITVEGKHLYVSSSVLGLTSPIFSNMLEAVFNEEGPKTLELKDNYDDLVEFLRCIYPGIMKPVTEDNALAIVSLANKYQVENVEVICKSILLDMVNGQSSLESLTSILNNASACQLTSVREKCVMEMTKRNIKDSELNKLDLSTSIILEIKTAKISYLEDEVHTLKGSLQKKTDRCEEFEHRILKTFLNDKRYEIENENSVKLHLISVNVSDNCKDNAQLVHFRNTTWTLEARISVKQDTNRWYQTTKQKELDVVLSAKGDRSWKEWRCKVNASCSVFDGVNREWKETTATLGSSRCQLAFNYCERDYNLFMKGKLNWNKPLKVSVIFAVGDITV